VLDLRAEAGVDVTRRRRVERHLLGLDQASGVVEVGRGVADPRDVRSALDRLLLADENVVVIREDERLRQRDWRVGDRGDLSGGGERG